METQNEEQIARSRTESAVMDLLMYDGLSEAQRRAYADCSRAELAQKLLPGWMELNQGAFKRKIGETRLRAWLMEHTRPALVVMAVAFLGPARQLLDQRAG